MDEELRAELPDVLQGRVQVRPLVSAVGRDLVLGDPVVEPVELARRHPKLITAEYRVAKRPRNHVLVDYNQNAWNRTLASVYSVRPKPEATVSTPITWLPRDAKHAAVTLPT